jgi:hypothetical protein
VVLFKTVEDRDYMNSLAYKLAGRQGHSVRLELPNHLLGQHRVLGKAGRELRTGQPGCRTHVNFDDDKERLVLDYKLKDKPWRRLCPDQASEAVGSSSLDRQAEETSAEDFRGLLRREGEDSATGANAQPIGE